MMIDDHDAGRFRLAFHARHEARVVVGAARSEARFTRRGDGESHWVVLAQRRKLTEIAAFGVAFPASDEIERSRHAGTQGFGALSELAVASLAEVIRETLDERRARFVTDRARDERQVLVEDLFLERARRGRNEHFFS